MTDQLYLRPIPDAGAAPSSRPLAGGPLRFDRVETLRRSGERRTLPVDALLAAAAQRGETGAPERLEAIERPRPPVAGLSLDRTLVMGVLNITPDSFSDGGVHFDAARAVESGLEMVEAGAAILDIGGESTRPGAAPTPPEAERDRVLPVIEGLKAAGCAAPISIDTRRALVARAAFSAGAAILNDVSALTHDPAMPEAAAELSAGPAGGWVCLMHSLGDPATMQDDPRYADPLLDIYDALAARMQEALAAGVPADRLIVDPGIGFGKTLEHNLALLRGFSLFHGLGAPLLLGVSRKRFIGTLSGEAEAAKRGPGSIAAGLYGAAQGAQILRVHDVAATAQALRVWSALPAQLSTHGTEAIPA